MKRRAFVTSSVLAGAAAVILPLATQAAGLTGELENEFYELRIYSLKNDTQQAIVDTFLKEVAIPAWNRLGVTHVGAFTELKPAGQNKLYVFIPYKSIAHYTQVAAKLEHDTTYQTQGAAYLNAPVTAPAYERIESSLLRAFNHMPKLMAPASSPRIFELRQYQSASESAGKKKIEMFNDKGEIDIFKRLGFKPVFFAETVIGALRPNLTYMVTFDDMAAHDAHWKAFGGDPEWKKISAVPEYADALLVSKITSTFLMPTGYSQI